MSGTIVDPTAPRTCRICAETKQPDAMVPDPRSGKPSKLCRSCRKTLNAAYRRSSHGSVVQQAAKHRFQVSQYGITPDQYAAMLESQGGVCAICKKKCLSGRRLAVDHCHITGRVRALLCVRCNQSLGIFEQFRDAAVWYLSKYGDGNPLIPTAVEYMAATQERPDWRPANAKLVDEQVRQIRERYAGGKGGISQRKLAAEYSVSQIQISRIIRSEQWSAN